MEQNTGGNMNKKVKKQIKICPFCGIIPKIDNIDYILHNNKKCILGRCIFTINAWNKPRHHEFYHVLIKN
jgi:hypothetical protein